MRLWRKRMGNKVSVLCDDNKVPLSILVFPANMADQKTVIPLFENLEVNLMNNNKTKLIVIADKGYTANAEMQEALAPFNAKLLASKRRAKGVKTKIKPPKKDRIRLKERYKIEHFNCRFKQFKRLDKRYDRKLCNFIGFFHIMSTLITFERGMHLMSYHITL